MIKATIRDLRYQFEKVEARLVRGEEVQITRRGRIVARLMPPDASGAVTARPDFAARLKLMWGDRMLPPSSELLEEVRRDKI